MDGRTDGPMHGGTDDGRKVITIAHPEQSSGELKKKLHESFLTFQGNWYIFRGDSSDRIVFVPF